MKTTKRIWPFVLADNKLAEAYLEKQAAKGLILERIGNYGFIATYRKEEPQDRHYCVDGFKGKKDEQGRYIRMAKDAGWHYVTQQPGHIFFTAEPCTNPVPTQTDWREEYQQIRKGLWSQDMPLGIFTTLFILLMVWLWRALEINESLPLNWETIYTYAIFVFIYIGFLKGILFYIKSAVALRRDKPMKPGSFKIAMLWGYARAISGIIMFAGLIYRCVSMMLPDMMGGVNITSLAGTSVIGSTILACVLGVKVVKTDELGRRVFQDDKKSKLILRGTWALIAASLLFYFSVSPNV